MRSIMFRACLTKQASGANLLMTRGQPTGGRLALLVVVVRS